MAMSRLLLRTRARQGWWRLRGSLAPVLLASLAAGVAYAIARYGLGHPAPFFAPVAAWVSLGFSSDRQLRRVGELAIGVSLGVGLGDLIVHFVGTGAVQVAVVLALVALTARFLDRGALLATQAGVQAIVIVGLPAVSTGGPLGRWTDALIGGGVALAFAALTPGDPRRRPRAAGAHACTEVAETLESLGRGLRSGSVADLDDALLLGRASQRALDEWLNVARSAQETARLSASGRRHRAELLGMERAAVLTDRAMRSIRVLARRAVAVSAAEHDLSDVVVLVERLGASARELAEATGAGIDPVGAREGLLEAARLADPAGRGGGDWQVQSLVLLLRSPLVDLLEAAGADAARAREALPEM